MTRDIHTRTHARKIIWKAETSRAFRSEITGKINSEIMIPPHKPRIIQFQRPRLAVSFHDYSLIFSPQFLVLLVPVLLHNLVSNFATAAISRWPSKLPCSEKL
jgi:hypothetical protein